MLPAFQQATLQLVHARKTFQEVLWAIGSLLAVFMSLGHLSILVLSIEYYL